MSECPNCRETQELVKDLTKSHAEILAKIAKISDQIAPAVEGLANGPMGMFFKKGKD